MYAGLCDNKAMPNVRDERPLSTWIIHQGWANCAESSVRSIAWLDCHDSQTKITSLAIAISAF
jgi:hypothetical protein